MNTLLAIIRSPSNMNNAQNIWTIIGRAHMITWFTAKLEMSLAQER